MDPETLIRRLRAVFLEELQEHVRALNDDLLALEGEPSGEGAGEALRRLFRTAHSLKGAARAAEVGLIERACHRLEEILSAARDGTAPLGQDRFALLFATADAVEEAGRRLREERDLADGPLAALLPRLEA